MGVRSPIISGGRRRRDLARLSGLAFDSTGALYASTVRGDAPPITSTLIRIDPDTGALIAAIGPITDGPGGPAIAISDLAVQPATGTPFSSAPTVQQNMGMPCA